MNTATDLAMKALNIMSTHDVRELDTFDPGEPHGLVWVHYDMNGNARVVRDQGGFCGGIDPVAGVLLDY